MPLCDLFMRLPSSVYAHPFTRLVYVWMYGCGTCGVDDHHLFPEPPTLTHATQQQRPLSVSCLCMHGHDNILPSHLHPAAAAAAGSSSRRRGRAARCLWRWMTRSRSRAAWAWGGGGGRKGGRWSCPGRFITLTRCVGVWGWVVWGGGLYCPSQVCMWGVGGGVGGSFF